MKDRIIGLILLLSGLVFLINTTSWGEIKYRRLMDSILHSKECKVIGGHTNPDYISQDEDFDCKNDSNQYSLDVLNYKSDCLKQLLNHGIENYTTDMYNCEVQAEADAEEEQKKRCDEDFQKFNDGQKVLIEADTNCNSGAFFDYVLTENGEIVSRGSVYTNEGKIKDFASLGRPVDSSATYKAYLFIGR